MTIWRMRIAYWILHATNTLEEYAILIVLPLEQWLQKLASMLGCTYIACLVIRVYDLLHILLSF
jgi:hypothetical protein